MKRARIFKKLKSIFPLLLALIIVIATVTGYKVYTHFGYWESNFLEDRGEVIQNPGRGFYIMQRVLVEDDWNYKPLPNPYRLALIEFNLKAYRNGPVSEEGLSLIGRVLESLAEQGKMGIIRFLYDWDAKASETEPENIETVLLHMEQLEPILKNHANSIFTYQGVFLGNWGEMHSSPLLDAVGPKILMDKLASVTSPENYLAVRTPTMWRSITGQKEGICPEGSGHPYAKRLGLFNDGLMGSETDLGTYVQGYRKNEYAFQDALCLYIPNGGEAPMISEFSHGKAFAEDMFDLHLTYLSGEFSRPVLVSWENERLEKGEGYPETYFNYIEGFLGYRLSVTEVKMTFNFKERGAVIEVTLKNRGAAPLYLKAMPRLIFERNKIKDPPKEVNRFILEDMGETDLRKLYPDSTLTLCFPLSDIDPKDTFDVYLEIKTPGGNIALANSGAFNALTGTNYLGQYIGPRT